MKKNYILFILVLTLVSCQMKNDIAIIPQPNNIERNIGKLDFKYIDCIIADKEAMNAIGFISQELSRYTGKQISLDSTKGNGTIRLTYNSQIQSEGYILTVKRKEIIIEASDYAGNIHALYTLLQLMPSNLWENSPDGADKIKIPCCRIEDSPRFGYRGMHLDVSRHFFSKEEVKKYIDILAIHKLNRFHWHLTDDTGWRLEIKKYPLLTSVSAWRAERGQDCKWDNTDPKEDSESCNYGGFYTQEDAKEIIAYARERAIEVIPEIEIPGHSCEVFAAYPTLSCSGKIQPVPTGGGPGYSKSPSSVFCAGKEEVFDFIKDVLTEVVNVFEDAPYIHIGGDEVNKLAWKQCRLCQRRIKSEGLADENELQSYIIKRVEKIVNDLGKPIIGWDEILEGGIAPGATVMSWRGLSGGIQAAKSGHDVIMTPGSHLYFDHLQDIPLDGEAGTGYLTTKKVYSYEPIPNELTDDEAKHILGAQANLWTENIWTFDRLTYMALPRACALSEVVWSKSKDWEDFMQRLSIHGVRLENYGFNCNKGCTNIEINASYSKGKYLIDMNSQIYGTEIRYTLDGSEPNMDSKLYRWPFNIKETTIIKAALFKDGKSLSYKPSTQKITFHKAIGKQIIYNTPASNEYPGKGDITLIDGLNGPTDLSSPLVQGFCEKNFDITIDLNTKTDIKSVSAGFIQSMGAWVYLPSKFKILVSDDGVNFKEISSQDIENHPENEPTCRREITSLVKASARYVRVIGLNETTEPGLPGGGKINWIFADEVSIE